MVTRRLFAVTVALVLAGSFLRAGDHPRRARQETGATLTHKVPTGAIKIPVPDIQQPDDYSCGAAALMSVASYFGVGPEEIDDVKKALGTNSRTGTSVYRIRDYARTTLKLDVTLVKDGFTKDALKQAIDNEHPVICSIQAYDDAQEYGIALDKCKELKYNKNGHFVVAIGYDADDNFYFMDPSLTGRRGFLSWADLDQRWHDNEGTTKNPEPHCHLAIVFAPGNQEPAYLSRARRID